jgi:hypothetical protein
MFKHTFRKHDSGAFKRRAKRGTGTLEMLVSFTLLLTTMSVATQTLVRYFRLTKSQEKFCLALDELSNQMDRLTVLPQREAVEAVRQLAPSVFVREHLPGVKLSGELHPMEAGTHLTLRISWNEIDRVHAPVQLSGWLFESSADAEQQNKKAETP